MKFHVIDPGRLLATIEQLQNRITERFPQANLGRIAAELHIIAAEHTARSHRIRRPNWLLRSASLVLLAVGLGTLCIAFASVRLRVDSEWRLSEALQTLDAGLSTLFFLGAGAVGALSLDQRSKRRRCLEALHELRAMAHIVDMHQLTKDPERTTGHGLDTPSSPARTMTAFELGRYLDYCSEMLALMGKVAALYVQDFPDPVAVAAVDDIEDLTNGLARKIWQKLMVLDRHQAGAVDAGPAVADGGTP